jgi:hypothetical protein
MIMEFSLRKPLSCCHQCLDGFKDRWYDGDFICSQLQQDEQSIKYRRFPHLLPSINTRPKNELILHLSSSTSPRPKPQFKMSDQDQALALHNQGKPRLAPPRSANNSGKTPSKASQLHHILIFPKPAPSSALPPFNGTATCKPQPKIGRTTSLKSTAWTTTPTPARARTLLSFRRQAIRFWKMRRGCG